MSTADLAPSQAAGRPDVTWGERRIKQISWYDPIGTARMANDLSGLEFLKAVVEGRIPRPPMAALFGMELVSVGEGEAVFRSAPDESVYNLTGMVHGGFLATLLDSAAGCAVHTLLPAGVGYSSIEIKVSFLRVVRSDTGPVEITGRALKVGRQIAFAEAHAVASGGAVVGHATSSIAVFRPGLPEVMK